MPTQNTTQNSLQKPSFGQALFRLIGGIGAGLSGGMLVGLIMFFSWSIVGDVLVDTISLIPAEDPIFSDEKTTGTNSLFIGVVLIAVFLGGLLANLVSCLVFSALDTKYQSTSTVITHTFIGNLAILIILLPIYFIASSLMGTDGVGITALVHIILASLFTFFVLEIFSKSPYILVSLYGAILAIIFFLFFVMILGSFSPSVLSILVLPIFLGMIGLGSGLSEVIYEWLKDNYGDFLDVNRRFGADSINPQYQEFDPEYEDL